MGVKTRITDLGVNYTDNSSGFQVDGVDVEGVSPGKLGTTTFSGSNTLTRGGYYELSGAGATPQVMPPAANVPGATFVFRGTTVHAWSLTGSQESNGTKVFTDGTSVGSRLTIPTSGSVALVCDGRNFLVTGKSGSIAFAGT